jgi:tetratricopeptide (TPR) repeat protein
LVKKHPEVDQAKRLLYLLFRHDMELDQADFAAASRTAAGQVSLYSKGKRDVPEEILDRAADARPFPRSLLQPALRAIRSFRAAARGWSRADRVVAETFFAEMLAVSGAALEAILEPAGPARQPVPAVSSPAAERDRAAGLWLRLEPRNARQRLVLVEEGEEYQCRALCALVAKKSIDAAPDSPAESLELAGLALRIAERCPGGKLPRQRSEGYAWFHVANSRRAANDLPGSDAALGTAARLWEAGAPGDPGYFDETFVFWIAATIRKEQRRFPEALQRIGEALAADTRGLRGKLLLTKAQILGALGDIEASTEALQEALRHVDEEREPRTALGILCEYLRNLCWQDRAVDAAMRLPQAQALAERLGQEIDLLRVDSLSGIVAAGTGQAEEAEETFERARRGFATHEPPLAVYYALASLELALLLLEQGRTSEVRTLAEEMMLIFSSQGVEREALAALQVFCEAARRETATVELARKVIRFLHRAQHDPGLKFEAGEAAEAP